MPPKLLNRLLFAGVLSAVAAIPPAAAQTSLAFSGDPGDYITDGQSYRYTDADGAFTLTQESGSFLSARFVGSGFTFWSVHVEAPEGETLEVGRTYLRAERAVVPKSGPFAGFDLSGNGRGCNSVNASFRVKQLVVGPDNAVQSAWIVFEQHCEGAEPAARGQLRHGVDVVVDLASPFERTVPWQQPLSFEVHATHASSLPLQLTARDLPSGATFTDHGDARGTLEWTPGFDQLGDYTVTFHADDGQGGRDSSTTTLSVRGASSFRVESDPGGLGAVDAGPGDGTFSAFKFLFQSGVGFVFRPAGGASGFWSVNLAGPGGSLPAPGVYENTAPHPYGSATQPLLSVRGPSGPPGCDESGGRFEVKEIAWNPDQTLRSLWVAFERRCAGRDATTYGEARFNANAVVEVRAPFVRAATTGDPLTFTVIASDVAGRPVTIVASALPAGASFVDHGDGTGTFTWTPTIADLGDHRPEFQASNGLGQSDHTRTTLHVTGRSALWLDFEPNRLGEGGRFHFTSDDGPFVSEVRFDNAEVVRFRQSDAPSFELGFQPAVGAVLDLGTYEAGHKISPSGGVGILANGVPRPALSRFCSQEAGSFRVKRISRSPGGRLLSLWATFAHFCDNEPDLLSGELRYNVEVALGIHAPYRRSLVRGETVVVDVTTDRANAAAAVTIAAAGVPEHASFVDHGDGTATLTWKPRYGQVGEHRVTFTAHDGLGNTDDVSTRIRVVAPSALRLSSAPDDAFGYGRDYDYGPGDGAFRILPYDPGGVAGEFTDRFFNRFDFGFNGPDGAALAPGFYPNAGRFPDPDPGRPGLLVLGSTFCPTTGAFDIRRLERNATGGIESFWVKFEERCEGAGGPLVGELRFQVDAPLLLDVPPGRRVFDGDVLSFEIRAIAEEAVIPTMDTPVPGGAAFQDHGNGTGTFTWSPLMTDAGNHRVRFRARTTSGLEDTAGTAIWVRHVNLPPVADAGGPYRTTVNTPLVFDGSGSLDPEGGSLSFSWSFGDGYGDGAQNPQHAYTYPGVFPVSLLVFDPYGLFAEDTTHVIVVQPADARAFVAGGPASVRLGSGKPTLCIQLEPVSGYVNEDVDRGSITLHRERFPQGDDIVARSTTMNEDRDHNGVSEIAACFDKSDLRTLFGDVRGRVTIPMILAARLNKDPGRVEARIEIEVVGGKGPLRALLQPSPDGQPILGFETQEPGFVRVAVFDLAGRRVSSVLDESAAAPGAREVDLGSGRRLIPGVYFYRVETPSHTQTGRFVLLR